MKTIYTTTIGGFTYKIEVDGNTYFVSNKWDCEGYFSTLRKAKNYLKRKLKYVA